MSKLQSRLARIEARLPQRAASSPWDLSLLSDEALEALAGFVAGSPTDEELMAMIPERMLRELERAYGGPDE
jgi:hypothetical protein